MVRERRKHASRSPISAVLAVRAVKTKQQETQSLRIEGYFFVWAVDAEKVCHLCKQEMLVTAGYAECDNNRVAYAFPRDIIFWQKKFLLCHRES